MQPVQGIREQAVASGKAFVGFQRFEIDRTDGRSSAGIVAGRRLNQQAGRRCVLLRKEKTAKTGQSNSQAAGQREDQPAFAHKVDESQKIPAILDEGLAVGGRAT